MTRSVVRPAAASALPGDPELRIDAAAIGPFAQGSTRITSAGPGLLAVHRQPDDGGTPSRPTRAVVGGAHQAGSGATLVEVVVDGWRFELEVEDAARADLRRRATRARDATPASGPTEIRAIIPGRIAAIRITVGDVVQSGQSLLVVEAMKMQNELRASRAGTVDRVAVQEGETIDNGDLLVVLR